MSKPKGLVLFEDFLDKLGVLMTRQKPVIKLEEMEPTWEARKRLEDYLNPPRDKKGHFAPKGDSK